MYVYLYTLLIHLPSYLTICSHGYAHMLCLFYISICLFINQSICRSISPNISIYLLYIYLCTYLSTYQLIYLSVYLNTCLSICIYLCIYTLIRTYILHSIHEYTYDAFHYQMHIYSTL